MDELVWTLKRYDPNQPRIPAGQSGGGQWTGGSGVLTDAEQTAVRLYTSQAYGAINSDLRRGRTLSDRNQEIVDNLDSAIRKSKLAQDTTVFRGVPQGHSAETVPIRPLDGKRIVEGAEFIETAYSSTSRSLMVAWQEGTRKAIPGEGVYLLEIRLKKGQSALDTGQHSAWGAEGEFLLPRKTKFRIVERDFDYGREDDVRLVLEAVGVEGG